MAFQRAFTDASGNVCPTAYWFPAQVNLGFANRTAYVVFQGWRDVDAWTQGKTPLPGAVKTYTITGPEFLSLYQEHIAPGGPNIAQMVFTYARNKKDVVVDPADPSKNVSFFEHAQEVP
jgi:hypothetical protein